MPKRRQDIPQLEEREFRSVEELDSAVAKIQRRIHELEALDIPDSLLRSTGAVAAVRSNIRATIREVFGLNSPEFKEHQYIDIWQGSMRAGMSAAERIQGMARG